MRGTLTPHLSENKNSTSTWKNEIFFNRNVFEQRNLPSSNSDSWSSSMVSMIPWSQLCRHYRSTTSIARTTLRTRTKILLLFFALSSCPSMCWNRLDAETVNDGMSFLPLTINSAIALEESIPKRGKQFKNWC